MYPTGNSSRDTNDPSPQPRAPSPQPRSPSPQPRSPSPQPRSPSPAPLAQAEGSPVAARVVPCSSCLILCAGAALLCLSLLSLGGGPAAGELNLALPLLRLSLYLACSVVTFLLGSVWTLLSWGRPIRTPDFQSRKETMPGIALASLRSAKEISALLLSPP